MTIQRPGIGLGDAQPGNIAAIFNRLATHISQVILWAISRFAPPS